MIVEVPVFLVMTMARVEWLEGVRSKKEEQTLKLSNIKLDIVKNGIKTPLPIVFAQDRFTLTDGHHRLVSACDIGLLKVPAQIELRDKNPFNHGIHVIDLLKLCAEHCTSQT